MGELLLTSRLFPSGCGVTHSFQSCPQRALDPPSWIPTAGQGQALEVGEKAPGEEAFLIWLEASPQRRARTPTLSKTPTIPGEPDSRAEVTEEREEAWSSGMGSGNWVGSPEAMGIPISNLVLSMMLHSLRAPLSGFSPRPKRETAWYHPHLREGDIQPPTPHTAGSTGLLYSPPQGSPDGSEGKESARNAEDTGDAGSIPGLGKSPGEGNGSPLRYSCLGESRGQRSLVGCSPQARKELERLSNEAHTEIMPRRGFYGP